MWLDLGTAVVYSSPRGYVRVVITEMLIGQSISPFNISKDRPVHTKKLAALKVPTPPPTLKYPKHIRQRTSRMHRH